MAESCPTCGGPVVVGGTPEGTNYFIPVGVDVDADDLRAENERLREALDWALDWIEHVSEAPSEEEERDYAKWEAAHEALTAALRTEER